MAKPSTSGVTNVEQEVKFNDNLYQDALSAIETPRSHQKQRFGVLLKTYPFESDGHEASGCCHDISHTSHVGSSMPFQAYQYTTTGSPALHSAVNHAQINTMPSCPCFPDLHVQPPHMIFADLVESTGRGPHLAQIRPRNFEASEFSVPYESGRGTDMQAVALLSAQQFQDPAITNTGLDSIYKQNLLPFPAVPDEIPPMLSLQMQHPFNQSLICDLNCTTDSHVTSGPNIDTRYPVQYAFNTFRGEMSIEAKPTDGHPYIPAISSAQDDIPQDVMDAASRAEFKPTLLRPILKTPVASSKPLLNSSSKSPPATFVEFVGIDNLDLALNPELGPMFSVATSSAKSKRQPKRKAATSASGPNKKPKTDGPVPPIASLPEKSEAETARTETREETSISISWLEPVMSPPVGTGVFGAMTLASKSSGKSPQTVHFQFVRDDATGETRALKSKARGARKQPASGGG